ncbi:MAG: hypothetical protein WA885_18740 [Phormidesmis sp.]
MQSADYTSQHIDRQVRLLQYQIQRRLQALDYRDCEVLERQRLQINDHCELKPALTVVKRGHADIELKQWVIDIYFDFFQEKLSRPETPHQRDQRRSRILAQAGIINYWSLSLAHAELRTYATPTNVGYRQCRLLQVGDRASPTLWPALTLRVQEPVPLYFLTRTLAGPRTYGAIAPPLQVISD